MHQVGINPQHTRRHDRNTIETYCRRGCITLVGHGELFCWTRKVLSGKTTAINNVLQILGENADRYFKIDENVREGVIPFLLRSRLQ